MAIQLIQGYLGNGMSYSAISNLIPQVQRYRGGCSLRLALEMRDRDEPGSVEWGLRQIHISKVLASVGGLMGAW